MSRTNSNLESTLALQRSQHSNSGHDTPTSFTFDRSVVNKEKKQN